MIPSYALPADLNAAPWNLTLVEANAVTLIAHACRLVRRATRTAIYTADPTTGLPTETSEKHALRDAACAQVASWVKLSIDPAAGAADPGKTIAQKSLGSASIQYVAYASTVEARARAALSLTQDALMILEDAGLVGGQPLVYG
jgi:hypothetical protein